MLFSLELSYLQYDDNRGQTGRVKKGLANWIDAGGHAYLVTFTNSHHKGDNLGDLLQGQKKAFVKFWEKRKVKEMLKRLGYNGRIVATEVTWGQDNGWHPHYHMIFSLTTKWIQMAYSHF